MTAIARATMLIRSPAASVFNAFVQPALLKKFWLKQATGPLSEGANVDWEFRVPGATETVEGTRFIEGPVFDQCTLPHRHALALYPTILMSHLRLATIHLMESDYEKVLHRNTVFIHGGTGAAAASRSRKGEESV